MPAAIGTRDSNQAYCAGGGGGG
eukprot:SAG11_NODE_4156_length_2034_cov_2.781395_1_plen_22_part_10